MFLGRTDTSWFEPSLRLMICNDPGSPEAASRFRLLDSEEVKVKFFPLNEFYLIPLVTKPNGLTTVL